MVSAQFQPQQTMIILSHYHENAGSAVYREWQDVTKFNLKNEESHLL